MMKTDQSGPIVVFDSGLGGLGIQVALERLMPDARMVYVADDAWFPYGEQDEALLKERILAVFEGIAHAYSPRGVVIACNTATTLALADLRARHDFPIVGTVPAIKPAALESRTGMVSVLATEGTIKRDYTYELISRFAKDVDVMLVGSPHLADLAEADLFGDDVTDDALLQEVSPCFKEWGGARTDVVILGCTHYPLLLDRFRAIQPWPVRWIDPAFAIARRAQSVFDQSAGSHEERAGQTNLTVQLTSGEETNRFYKALEILRGNYEGDKDLVD